MRVVIAGGGTGGHLFPGIALAEELRARGGHEVRFVGTAKGIESRVVPREGWPLDLIDIGGLKGAGPLGVVRGLARVPRSLWQSLALLSRFRPDVVVGVGGYASGPLLLAAAWKRLPTAILEQNSVPGLTNRILGRIVDTVFAAFEESRPFFPGAKVRLLGNPIRARFHEAAIAGRGVAAPSAERRVLVCGGSQGAHAVNQLVVEAMKLLAAAGRAPLLVHQSGAADAAWTAAEYTAAGLAVTVCPFIDDMASAYRAADLVVGRAGATTLAELTTIGRAAILIPFPFAADDHQTVNARALERAGAATVLPQRDLTPRALATAMTALLDDPAARARMAAASLALGRPEATRAIVDSLCALAGAATAAA